MQPDPLRNGPIEEIGLNGFADVSPEVIPGVALRENVEGQAFGATAPIGPLRDLEDQFGNASS
jgi:hypothetical protein